MYWHIETDMISLAATCFLLLYHYRMRTGDARDPNARSFGACLWVCAVVTAIDIAASVVMEVPTTRLVYHLMMTLYFLSVMQCILSWFYFSLSILYIDDPKTKRGISAAAAIPYAAYALVTLSNPWTGLFYTLGPNLEYERGPIFFSMVLVFAAYTLAIAVLTLVRRRHIPRRYSAHVLILIPIMLAASIFLQLTHGGWLVMLPTYALCLLLAFLFLQSRVMSEQQTLVRFLSVEASTDKLTGALNRAGAETRLREIANLSENARCLVAVADVDDLKIINDTLGHDGGDRALTAVARVLQAHFPPPDVVARFGGDEFVVFSFGARSEDEIRLSLGRLKAELTNVPIESSGCVVNASVGAALGGQNQIEELMRRADAALYEAKRGGKNRCALYDQADDARTKGGA